RTPWPAPRVRTAAASAPASSRFCCLVIGERSPPFVAAPHAPASILACARVARPADEPSPSPVPSRHPRPVPARPAVLGCRRGDGPRGAGQRGGDDVREAGGGDPAGAEIGRAHV